MTERTKNYRRNTIRAVLPSFRMEGDGRGNFISVTFSGIRGIKELSDTAVKLSTKRECIELCGNKLLLTVFENKTVEISGCIEKIIFSAETFWRRGK